MKSPSVLHGQKGIYLHNMQTAYTFHLPISRRLNNESAASRSSGLRVIVILTFPVSQWFSKDSSPHTAAGPHRTFTCFPIMPASMPDTRYYYIKLYNYRDYIIKSFCLIQKFHHSLYYFRICKAYKNKVTLRAI